MDGQIERQNARAAYSLACTRYCHYQYCIVYSIHKEGSGRVSYLAQQPCNSIATVWAMQAGRKNEGMIDSCTND